MTPLQERLIQTLKDLLGTSFDTDDAYDGRLTAHAALTVAAWVLESFGLPAPESPGSKVEALATAHRRKEREWEFDDDDLIEWPLPAADYATLIGEVLGVDFGTLTPGPWRPAPARFGAPTTDVVIGCIQAHRDFQANDPDTWQIQLRVGGPIDDPQDELDRFIQHWSYMRRRAGSWIEINRGKAVAHLTWLQRHSLAWSRNPYRDPGERAARSQAEDFLYCFPKATRYFSNSDQRDTYSFRITPFTFDTGVIAFSERLAGMWWHAEDD